ncbi:MAG: type II toxin-antitoxin system HicA family toxin [Methanospirillum sp.]|nr:type II toxin-antitoxin system HicA family toxin [Methanospirillum sp.]MDD1729461.1 type II toxin-antitoxin system HicA family toxin [Methanospirillum sp.]
MQMAFSRHGFTKARQIGSHVIMVKHGMDVTLSVPLHDPMKR